MTEEEKQYVDSLIINALMVPTDEKEGQQVIDLDSLNLCEIDYSNDVDTDDYIMPEGMNEEKILTSILGDKNLLNLLNASPDNIKDVIKDIPLDNKIIIEFADATIKYPEPVKYTITVDPGQLINEETIIGFVEQEGEMKKIKSIFSNAKVTSINDDTEYMTLFPSRCNRHIILENAKPESGNSYDITLQIQEVSKEFQDEAALFDLITNNMCQSLLPYVLSRRYRGVYTLGEGNFNNNIVENYFKQVQINGETKWYNSIADEYYDYNFLYQGKWNLAGSDLQFDSSLKAQTEVIFNSSLNPLKLSDNITLAYSIDNKDTGLKIFDSSIMHIIEEYQNNFIESAMGNISKDDIKSWKKRAKKKKNRKKVQEEIQSRADDNTETLKHTDNVEGSLTDMQNRIMNARDEYVNKCIEIYNNKNKLPLCKFDPNYTDCKFLVHDKIDKEVLKNVQSINEDFNYTVIGEEDYFNYYISLLTNINTRSNNEYALEFYNIIKDIIDKRIIIESIESRDMKLSFIKLFRENISESEFTIYKNDKLNTDSFINAQFTKFENKINSFVISENKKYTANIKTSFKDKNLNDEAIKNAGTLYTDDNKYMQIHDYIKSIGSNDSDDMVSDYTVSQLTAMYMYIKSYNGNSNPYKNINVKDDKYLYFRLVQEESQKITEFWDKIISIYSNTTLNKCIEDLYTLSNSFADYATWPIPSEVQIGNTKYQHYLFEQMYKKDIKTTNVSIGNYQFPNEIKYPDIPNEVVVNEEDAINDLNNPEQIEPTKDEITIFDPEYWRRYFTLATLIGLPYLNCGLDIPPYIFMIQFPCIFIAFTCVYIPFFNLLIVFGISFRLMYFSPVILYINTSDQASSVLTPLVGILNQLKDTFNSKIDEITVAPIQLIVNEYINKLQNENNKLQRENKKINVYKDILKHVQVPNSELIKRQFAKVVDPYIDLRQKYTSLDRLVKKQLPADNKIS